MIGHVFNDPTINGPTIKGIRYPRAATPERDFVGEFTYDHSGARACRILSWAYLIIRATIGIEHIFRCISTHIIQTIWIGWE